MKCIFPLLLGLLLWSCQTQKPSETPVQPTKSCQKIVANTSVSLGVKGMVCKMGCGGSIRKALKETCAVDQVAVSYIDTLEEQTIVVNYDRKKIAPEQIISVLSKINDKQFEVRLLGSPKQL